MIKTFLAVAMTLAMTSAFAGSTVAWDPNEGNLPGDGRIDEVYVVEFDPNEGNLPGDGRIDEVYVVEFDTNEGNMPGDGSESK